jgi:hypothetical protein
MRGVKSREARKEKVEQEKRKKKNGFGFRLLVFFNNELAGISHKERNLNVAVNYLDIAY